jgi:HD-like signal output (HDOD) protein
MSISFETHRSTIPADTEERLRAKSKELQVFPEVARQAIDLLSNADCSLPALVDVVNRDPKLATDILCIANSAMYAAQKPALSLQQAVNRLGLRRCRNLIIVTCVAALTRSIEIDDDGTREALIRHGFLTGVVASSLNSELRCGFQGEEFAAGLLHDFGRMLLALCFPATFPQFDSLNSRERDFDLRAEHAAAGVDHCEAGQWFARSKKLPDEFAAVMRYHHHPADSEMAPELVGLVSFADDIVNHLTLTGTAAGYLAEECDATKLLQRHGVKGDFQLAAEEAMLTAEAKASEMMQL